MALNVSGSSNTNRITFNSYGAGKALIIGGKKLDYSRFSHYSGTPGTNAVYRATISSLGLTGANISGLFEAGNYNSFRPRSDIYYETSSP